MAGGRPGRPAKTLEQHRQDGTYRPSVHGPGVELAPRITADEAVALTAPDHLTERQADAWRDLVAPIAESGVLAASDLASFSMAAVALATFREANELVARDGLLAEIVFAKDKNTGEPLTRIGPNPALAIRDRAEASFSKWAGLFGLTPSDRVRLGLGQLRGLQMTQAVEAGIGPSPRQAKRRAAAETAIDTTAETV